MRRHFKWFCKWLYLACYFITKDIALHYRDKFVGAKLTQSKSLICTGPFRVIQSINKQQIERSSNVEI